MVAVSRPRLTGRSSLLVRPASFDDLRVTSRAHVELLPLGVFPSLGARFVRRWHRTYLESRYGVGYVAVDPTAPAGGFVGFLLGTTDQANHVTALLTDRRAIASLVVTGVGALVRRPRVAARLLRTRAWPWARRLLSRRPGSAEPDRPAATPRIAVMVALAVEPAWRGSGIGRELVARFVEHARLAGATTAELVTSAGPDGAASFYERLGWRVAAHRRTRDGNVLYTYRRHLYDTGPVV